MYTRFEDMPPHSRVWIYQSDRRLTEDESEFIKRETRKFTDQWTAHNNALKASFDILYGHFLVISVDEGSASASGCSIDKSVHFIKQLQGELGLSFFNRTMIPFLVEDDVQLIPMGKLKDNIDQQVINEETTTFDNLVTSIGEMREKWKIRAADSWLSRYFRKAVVSGK